MSDLSHLRPKVEIVKAHVEQNPICKNLNFDWDNLSAQVESLTQRGGKLGYGFGYNNLIKSKSGKHVFFVEKWKISKKPGSIPSITGHDKSFQVNETYIYKPSEHSSNYSLLKVLEDVDDEIIATQIIQFIIDNLHLN